MNHRADSCLINPQAKSDCANEHANLIGHPALLVLPAGLAAHLAVISNGRNAALLDEIDRLLDTVDGGRINDNVAARVLTQGSQK